MRVVLGFLRRQPSCPDELADERVVGRELLEDVVAKAVGAGVADVSDRNLACLLVDEQRRDDRSHPCRGGVLERVAIDPVVRLLQQLHERALTERVGRTLLQRRRSEVRGDLARLGAADPVGDREERRLADVCVLVLRPSPAGVRVGARPAGSHASTLRSVWPIRTMSPGARSRAVVTRAPLTKVPFVDPTSST